MVYFFIMGFIKVIEWWGNGIVCFGIVFVLELINYCCLLFY